MQMHKQKGSDTGNNQTRCVKAMKAFALQNRFLIPNPQKSQFGETLSLLSYFLTVLL